MKLITKDFTLVGTVAEIMEYTRAVSETDEREQMMDSLNKVSKGLTVEDVIDAMTTGRYL